MALMISRKTGVLLPSLDFLFRKLATSNMPHEHSYPAAMKSYIYYILFYVLGRHQMLAFTSPLTTNVVDRRTARRDMAMVEIITSAATDEAEADNSDELALLFLVKLFEFK